MAVSWLTDHLSGGQLEVSVAWGANLAADSSTWTWTEITGDVLQDPGIAVTLGRANEASTTQPAQCAMTLDNRSGNYSVGGESVNWPYVRQGTPVRVRVNPDGTGLVTLFQGEAVGWTPAWPYHTFPTVKLEAAGSLRRLQQGGAALGSAISRSITNLAPSPAYWPCEDLGVGNWFRPAIGPTVIWVVAGVPTFATDTNFLGSDALAKVRQSMWTAGVGPYSSSTHVKVGCLVEFPDSDTSETDGGKLLTVITSGTAAVFEVIFKQGSGGQLSVNIYDQLLGTISNNGPYTMSVCTRPTQNYLELDINQSGGDVVSSLTVVNLNDSSLGGTANLATATGRTMGSVGQIRVNNSQILKDVAVGHVFVDITSANISGSSALKGWVGETARARIVRLASEQSENMTVVGLGAVMMGPQKDDTIVNLLRDCELSDGGTLFDGLTQGLYYITRAERENRQPDLTLTATSSHVKAPFSPVHDDQRIRNKAVVTRYQAGKQTFTDISSNLGTTAVGTYEVAATINVSRDSDAYDFASWLVHTGTVEGYRYPTLALNLAATPSLASSVLGLRPGYRVDVTGLDTALSEHPGSGPLSLIVEGVQHKLTAKTWEAALQCSSYDPWRIGCLSTDTASPAVYLTDIAGATGNNTSLTVNCPTTSITKGDLLLLYASIRNSGTGTVNTPSGWTQLFSSGNIALFGMVNGDTDTSSVTVTFANGAAGADTIAQVFAVRGTQAKRLTNLANVVHVSNAQLNGSAQNIAIPGLTISHDDCLVLCGWWKQDQSTGVVNPYSFSDGPTDMSSSAGSGACQGIDVTVQSTASSYAPGTATVTGGASAISRGWMLALLPDPTPDPIEILDTDASTLTSSISAGATSMQVSTTAAPTISYVGAGTAGQANNGGSIAPSLPAAVVSGDLMVIVATIGNAAATVNVPADWNQLVSGTGNLGIFGRYYQAGDGPPTVSFSGSAAGDSTLAWTFAFRGLCTDIGRVVHASASQSNAAGANVALPALTITEDRCLVLAVGQKNVAWTSTSALTGFTNVGSTHTTVGNGDSQDLQYEVQTTAANVGATSITVTGDASVVSRGVVLALRTNSVNGRWTTNSLDYPLDLDVGGVKVTATACSGTVSPQTMTINAAAAARTSGAPVKLWRPAVLGRA